MRISHDEEVCSMYHLHGLGETTAGDMNFSPWYVTNPGVAETFDEFKKKCRAAVKRYEEECVDDEPGPRMGSFIDAVTIEKQPRVSKFLLDLGFTGTGWVKFGKYLHKAQHFVMPLPLFFEAIGVEYDWSRWKGAHD